MKKFIVTALVVLLALPMSAEVKFGLRGGLNITNMSLSSDVFNTSNRTGFFVGPTVKIGLPFLGFDIDASALYDQREAKVESDVLRRKVLAVPLNLRKGFGLGDNASFFFFAGPQFNFSLNSSDDVKNWSWKSSDFSVNVGAGVMFAKHFEVKADYNIPCGKSGEADVKNLDLSSKSGAWQIGLAYYF